MNREQIFKVLNVMSIKAAVSNISKKEGKIRECPTWSELQGMKETLKLLGVKVDYKMDENNEITALETLGITVEVFTTNKGTESDR